MRHDPKFWSFLRDYSSVILCKDDNIGFTTAPLKSLSDKKCGRYCCFSGFSSSCTRNMQVTFVKKEYLKLIRFLNYNIIISNSFLINQRLDRYRCESYISILNEVSFEITLTVPLNNLYFWMFKVFSSKNMKAHYEGMMA